MNNCGYDRHYNDQSVHLPRSANTDVLLQSASVTVHILILRSSQTECSHSKAPNTTGPHLQLSG
jgi:hypothetical protein